MREGFKDICVLDRKGSNCRKWDELIKNFGVDDVFPLWVADMDFKAPQCVRDALHQAIDQGILGYYHVPDSYYQNYINWQKKHHNYTVQQEWIRFSPRIICCLHFMVQALTKPGDAVAIMTPVYYPFMNAATDTGRKLVCSQLINNQGYYTVDYDQFEKDISENEVKLFILSSPHNPVGRVWKREELKQILDICKKHHVYVLADEIHGDIVFGNNRHIAAATVGDYDEILISMHSVSKTFNLAGCQNSYIVIPDAGLRRIYDEYVGDYLRIREGSNLGYIAAEAAYKGGEEWLEAVLEEIWNNYIYMRDTLSGEFPKLVISPLEGTYLPWVDFGAYVSHDELRDFMLQECHLAPDFGDWFYDEGNKNDTHIRMNLAMPYDNARKVTGMIAEALKKRIRQSDAGALAG